MSNSKKYLIETAIVNKLSSIDNIVPLTDIKIENSRVLQQNELTSNKYINVYINNESLDSITSFGSIRLYSLNVEFKLKHTTSDNLVLKLDEFRFDIENSIIKYRNGINFTSYDDYPLFDSLQFVSFKNDYEQLASQVWSVGSLTYEVKARVREPFTIIPVGQLNYFDLLLTYQNENIR